MSPEQVRGQLVDHRSDIFSLGCVLFEMLSGTRAFQGETPSTRCTPSCTASRGSIDPRRRTAHTRSHRRPKPGESAGGTLSDGERSRVCPQRGRHYAGGIAARAAALRRGHHRAGVALRGGGVAVEATVIDRFRRHPARCGSTGAPRHRRLTVRESRRHRPGVLAAGLTEEVTLRIAKISALRVMSRAAVARFTGGAAELPAMTRELASGPCSPARASPGTTACEWGALLAAPPQTCGVSPTAGRQDPARRSSTVASASLRHCRHRSHRKTRRIERPPTQNAEAYHAVPEIAPLSNLNAEQNRQASRCCKRPFARCEVRLGACGDRGAATGSVRSPAAPTTIAASRRRAWQCRWIHRIGARALRARQRASSRSDGLMKRALPCSARSSSTVTPLPPSRICPCSEQRRPAESGGLLGDSRYSARTQILRPPTITSPSRCWCLTTRRQRGCSAPPRRDFLFPRPWWWRPSSDVHAIIGCRRGGLTPHSPALRPRSLRAERIQKSRGASHGSRVLRRRWRCRSASRQGAPGGATAQSLWTPSSLSAHDARVSLSQVRRARPRGAAH